IEMDNYLNRAICRLNGAYQPGEKIRPHNERSRRLEQDITIAFQNCDIGPFKRTVDEWESFFKPKPKE
ncbi:MAG: hypothetical protein SV686_03255, partial [Thermodesulfobacteriota bacterium]|nr:hypothetical protein [Thermodesulfobacteriota bacterium]